VFGGEAETNFQSISWALAVPVTAAPAITPAMNAGSRRMIFPPFAAIRILVISIAPEKT
jgi:hypothetical protein